jgi:predicted nucleic acid-binding protein
MKKILFDTNVILDVLMDRKPWSDASARVWASVEGGAAEGLLAAHAVTTIHYLLRKELGNVKANRIVSSILRVFGVAAVNAPVLQEALQLPFSDFEDAVTAAAARSAGCECIVTRDPKGFRRSHVRPLSPEAVTLLLAAS